MLMGCVISNASYILIPPFLPLKLDEKGVDKDMVGLIFAAYPIAVILWSPQVGRLVTLKGPKFFLILGLILMGTSFIGFGLIDYPVNSNFIIFLAVGLRFL
jgi:MFS family permease